jgi:hypothetical protein
MGRIFFDLRTMNYIGTDGTVATLNAVRSAHPNMSIPEGADLTSIGYERYAESARPACDPMHQAVREAAPVYQDGQWLQQWEIYELNAEDVAINMAAAKSAAWERIKSERDRRAALGVKVGAHWYHSDQKSRTQQLGLVLLGASIPAGLQWKTLTFTPPPVFVSMTPALAQAIVGATAASDTAIFTAAEAHRLAMEAGDAPQDYDFSVGWPTSIEEEANAEGIQFDARLL